MIKSLPYAFAKTLVHAKKRVNHLRSNSDRVIQETTYTIVSSMIDDTIVHHAKIDIDEVSKVTTDTVTVHMITSLAQYVIRLLFLL